MKNRAIILVIFISILAGAGCTTINSIPLAARLGDTVMISVGSPEGMDSTNTSITYTPDGGTAAPLTIRSIFNMYPDKLSAAWQQSDAPTIENFTGHGPWTTVIMFDLPDDGSISTGTGTVQVNTSATYEYNLLDIDFSNIGLTILPGTGESSDFDYEGLGSPVGITLAGDITQLEPLPRILIKPPYDNAMYGGTTYGAVEVAVNIPSLNIVNENEIKIVVDEKIEYADKNRVSSTWSKNGDVLTIMFISPIGGIEYTDVHFSIISDTMEQLFVGGAFTMAQVAIAQTYYDINGVVDTSGPALNKIKY